MLLQRGTSLTMRIRPSVSLTRYRWWCEELARLTISSIPAIYSPIAITNTCAPVNFNWNERYSVISLCMLDWPSVRIKTRLGIPGRAPFFGSRISLVHFLSAACVFVSPLSNGITLKLIFSMASSCGTNLKRIVALLEKEMAANFVAGLAFSINIRSALRDLRWPLLVIDLEASMMKTAS